MMSVIFKNHVIGAKVLIFIGHIVVVFFMFVLFIFFQRKKNGNKLCLGDRLI